MPSIAYATASHGWDDAPKAYDADPTSRWTTGVPMAPGMFYSLDLGALSLISGISARAADDTDNPASWQVKVRGLGCLPESVVVATGRGPIVATWPAIEGQRIIIECLSADDFYWWSIAELAVDAVDAPPYVEPPPVEPPPPEPVEPPPDTASEEWARGMVEYWADKFGWAVRQRDVVDFTYGVGYSERCIVYMPARINADGSRDDWPWEPKPIG